MLSKSNEPVGHRDDDDAVTDLKVALRDVRVQLAVLNHHVGARADVRDADFDCLDLVSIHEPVSPSMLAKLAGLHPATLTGILDRLERGGWITRDRGSGDRRAVAITMVQRRNTEVLGLYESMNARLDGICAEYDDAQIALITDFLRRVHVAGVAESERLTAAPQPQRSTTSMSTRPARGAQRVNGPARR